MTTPGPLQTATPNQGLPDLRRTMADSPAPERPPARLQLTLVSDSQPKKGQNDQSHQRPSPAPVPKAKPCCRKKPPPATFESGSGMVFFPAVLAGLVKQASFCVHVSRWLARGSQVRPTPQRMQQTHGANMPRGRLSSSFGENTFFAQKNEDLGLFKRGCPPAARCPAKVQPLRAKHVTLPAPFAHLCFFPFL